MDSRALKASRAQSRCQVPWQTMHTIRATFCTWVAHYKQSVIHQRHIAGQWHKFKTRADCALSPFMYGCI